MKVGNTNFNPKAIKDMTYSQFEKQYKGILKGVDFKEAYEKLTGKKVKGG